jgi:hypothetical protein
VLPLFAFGWSVASLVAVPLSFLFCYRSLSVIDRELSEHATARSSWTWKRRSSA